MVEHHFHAVNNSAYAKIAPSHVFHQATEELP